MKLKKIDVMPDYVLRIHLDDGSIIDFDIKPEIDRIPCYKPLRDAEFFKTVQFKNQRIYWNERFDFHLDQIMQQSRNVSQTRHQDDIAKGIAELHSARRDTD